MSKFIIKAIVFDLDATLVDSKLDFDKMRHDIGIPGNQPILEYLENVDDKDFLKRAYSIIDRHEYQGAMQAVPNKDALSFIKKLQQNSFPLGILTRNSTTATKLTCERLNWTFDLILTRDNSLAKPSPDGLYEMSRFFGVPTEQILYIGDHEFDLHTAFNANAIAGLIKNQHNLNLIDKADIAIDFFYELEKYFLSK